MQQQQQQQQQREQYVVRMDRTTGLPVAVAVASTDDGDGDDTDIFATWNDTDSDATRALVDSIVQCRVAELSIPASAATVTSASAAAAAWTTPSGVELGRVYPLPMMLPPPALQPPPTPHLDADAILSQMRTRSGDGPSNHRNVAIARSAILPEDQVRLLGRAASVVADVRVQWVAVKQLVAHGKPDVGDDIDPDDRVLIRKHRSCQFGDRFRCAVCRKHKHEAHIDTRCRCGGGQGCAAFYNCIGGGDDDAADNLTTTAPPGRRGKSVADAAPAGGGGSSKKLCVECVILMFRHELQSWKQQQSITTTIPRMLAELDVDGSPTIHVVPVYTCPDCLDAFPMTYRRYQLPVPEPVIAFHAEQARLCPARTAATAVKKRRHNDEADFQQLQQPSSSSNNSSSSSSNNSSSSSSNNSSSSSSNNSSSSSSNNSSSSSSNNSSSSSSNNSSNSNSSSSSSSSDHGDDEDMSGDDDDGSSSDDDDDDADTVQTTAGNAAATPRRVGRSKASSSQRTQLEQCWMNRVLKRVPMPGSTESFDRFYRRTMRCLRRLVQYWHRPAPQRMQLRLSFCTNLRCQSVNFSRRGYADDAASPFPAVVRCSTCSSMYCHCGRCFGTATKTSMFAQHAIDHLPQPYNRLGVAGEWCMYHLQQQQQPQLSLTPAAAAASLSSSSSSQYLLAAVRRMDERVLEWSTAACPRCAIGRQPLPESGDARVTCQHCRLDFCFFCSGAMIDDFDEYCRGKEMGRQSRFCYAYGHHAKVFRCGVGKRDLYKSSHHFCPTTYNTAQQQQNMHRLLTFLQRPNNSCLPNIGCIPWLDRHQYVRARVALHFRKYRAELQPAEFLFRFRQTQCAQFLPWLRNSLELSADELQQLQPISSICLELV